MDKKSFKKLNIEEKKLKLTKAIAIRTQRLPYEEVDEICNKISDINAQYRINIYNNPGRFNREALHFKDDEDLYQVLTGNIVCSIDGYDFNPDKTCSFEKHKMLRAAGFSHEKQIANRSIEIYIPLDKYEIDPLLQQIKDLIDSQNTI